MDGANKKAWELLNDDEQLALSLKHGYGKSTWEAGEIMNKAHYKFLEIEARAKTFLKLFSDHIELYEDMVPSYLPLRPKVRTYLNHTVVNRMTPKEAVEEIDDIAFSIKSVRDKEIIEDLEKLANSKSVVYKNFVVMVMEFDRWNNFRILPKEIQEPSAYKRRNKNNDKKNIKNILTMNAFTIDKIRERYEHKSDHHNAKVVYVPVFSKFIPFEESILRIKHTEEAMKELSKVGLYIFSQLERAEQFLELIYNYDFDSPKHCKQGQNFWPKYRVLLRHSMNYNNIRKRIASRKFLESALRDLDIVLLNATKKEKPQKKRRKKKDLGFDN